MSLFWILSLVHFLIIYRNFYTICDLLRYLSPYPSFCSILSKLVSNNVYITSNFPEISQFQIIFISLEKFPFLLILSIISSWSFPFNEIVLLK